MLRSGAPLLPHFFHARVRARVHYFNFETKFSAPVALRDLIFSTHLDFIVSFISLNFIKIRQLITDKKAKNRLRLSKWKIIETLNYSRNLNSSQREMINFKLKLQKRSDMSKRQNMKIVKFGNPALENVIFL